MRKIWCSPKLAPIWSLSSFAEARSRPMGFSTTMREFSVTSLCSLIRFEIMPNREGATAR